MPGKVYLCGPINGCTDDEAINWREAVKEALGAENCLDPMRRDFRGAEGDHTAAIVNGDLADIEECAVVLANCWQPGWGTAMEIFHANYTWPAKAVVAVLPPGTKVSPWLRYHATVVFSLDEAIDFARVWA